MSKRQNSKKGFLSFFGRNIFGRKKLKENNLWRVHINMKAKEAVKVNRQNAPN